MAEIYAGGQNVNLQMVQEGYAVVYTQFLRSCPETGSALQAAEAQARLCGAVRGDGGGIATKNPPGETAGGVVKYME